jgi:transposase InsO family protein
MDKGNFQLCEKSVKTITFDGTNFPVWKFKMETLLMQKGCHACIGRDRQEAMEATKKELWEARDALAYSTLVLSMADSQVHLVQNIQRGDAHGVWQRLLAEYERNTMANRNRLRRQLHHMKMKGVFSEYAEGILNIASQLKGMNDVVSHGECLMVLLDGLPEEYSTIVTIIENMETVTFSQAQSMIHDFAVKLQLKAESFQETTEVANYAKGNSEARNRRGNETGTKQQKTCFYCDKPGHFVAECKKKKRDIAVREKKPSTIATVGEEKLENHQHKANVTNGGNSDSDYLLSTSHLSSGNGEWVLDSGATSHMCTSRESMFNCKAANNVVRLADNNKVIASLKGKVRIFMRVGGTTKAVTLCDVLYIPELKRNLVSVRALCATGCTVNFKGKTAIIKSQGNKKIAYAVEDGKLFKLDGTADKLIGGANALSVEREEPRALKKRKMLALWHQRLGHVSQSGLLRLKRSNGVIGIDFDEREDLDFCQGCIEGKAHKVPFPKQSGSRATDVLRLVHSDVCDMHARTVNGERYFVSFIDDFSRFATIYIIKTKDEVLNCFKKFHKEVTVEKGKPLVCLRSDGGGEYFSKAFDVYCEVNGIQRQRTIAKTPEQNGVAERFNRTIVEMMRSMLLHNKISKGFWGEAARTASYIRNRCLTRANDVAKTPYELWKGKQPNVEHMRVFGCTAYIHVPDDERSKLDPKTIQGKFMGYDSQRKAYRVYIQRWNKFTFSRNVTFDETFPASCTHNTGTDGQNPPESLPEEPTIITREDDEEDMDHSETEVFQSEQAQMEQHDGNEMGESASQDQGVEEKAPGKDAQEEIPEYLQRKSTREWHPTLRYLENFANVASEIEGYRESNMEEPNNFAQAAGGIHANDWKDAMERELQSLSKNNTWELVKCPKGRKPIGCKWVYKIKYNSDGTVERYKARLVAKGYSQVEGTDYDETYSPVAKMQSIRSIIAISAKLGLEITHSDVETAFLNGTLDFEVYMQQPEIPSGGEVLDENGRPLVCLLRKSLYGLKQASRIWNQDFDHYVRDIGFTYCETDHCVYVLKDKNILTIVAVYVDDLVIASNDEGMRSRIHEHLSKRYSMKNLGELSWCLGMRVTRDREHGVIKIDQSKYVQNLLKRFGMENCATVSTPLETGLKLTEEMSPKTIGEEREMARVPYRSAVGALMYAMVATRPDIAYAVGAVSRFASRPGMLHWRAVKRILRYLKGTTELGISFSRGSSSEVDLLGYSDADWAGEEDSRRSTTGYSFFLAGGPVSWCSKLQQAVALSSAEAEYLALSSAVQEAVWLRQLLREIGFPQGPTVIFEDNQGCIALAKNPSHHKRTKHIDIRYHFIRQHVQNQEVELKWLATKEMVSDMLTKPLAKDLFQNLRQKIMGS